MRTNNDLSFTVLARDVKAFVGAITRRDALHATIASEAAVMAAKIAGDPANLAAQAARLMLTLEKVPDVQRHVGTFFSRFLINNVTKEAGQWRTGRARKGFVLPEMPADETDRQLFLLTAAQGIAATVAVERKEAQAAVAEKRAATKVAKAESAKAAIAAQRDTKAETVAVSLNLEIERLQARIVELEEENAGLRAQLQGSKRKAA